MFNDHSPTRAQVIKWCGERSMTAAAEDGDDVDGDGDGSGGSVIRRKGCNVAMDTGMKVVPSRRWTCVWRWWRSHVGESLEWEGW
jgi:hypothetical protein